MSSSVAPLFPKTSVFIPAYWATARAETLTQEEADARYLRFPTGQGTESIPNLIVSGTSTLGTTSTNALSSTTITATNLIKSFEEIICEDSVGNSNIDIMPGRITGFSTGGYTMNLSMDDGFTYSSATRQIYNDPDTGTTRYSLFSPPNPTIPFLTIGLEATPSCILQAEYSVGDNGLFTIRNFNADDQYSYTTYTTGDDLGTSPIATIGVNDPTGGSISYIAVENLSINFVANNASIASFSSGAYGSGANNCLYYKSIRFDTDAGVLEQSVINTTTTGQTNLVFNSTNAYRTIINTPTASGRIFLLPSTTGQQVGGWFKICNKSTAFTIAVCFPTNATTIFTIPVSPTGGAGSVAKFAIDNAGTAYFRAG